MADGLIALLAGFAAPATRIDAARQLAHRLGVDRVLLYVRDPELGTLQPAPGFPQTVQGGAEWRAFVRSCARPGTYDADVDGMHVTAYVRNDVALFIFGGTLDRDVLEHTLAAMPLVGGILKAEHETKLAEGQAQLARVSGRHANDLAVALDAARAQGEKALAELARLNAELRDRDRRKDDFLAMLGHELRNPMAAISGAIEIMRAQPDDVDRIAKARVVLERQAEQLARLVDDLLDVARITRGKVVLKRERLELESVARRAVDAARAIAEAKGHELELDVRTPVLVEGDRTRVEQMITNLLTNAIKYTDAGGHIRVIVDRDGSDARVAVDDDGIGIPENMLARIFDAFQQVEPTIDRSAGGLGVGLTVVSRLAELHGGRVEVTSQPGQGSRFSIRLPAITRDAVGSVPIVEDEVSAARAAEPGSKRILVVDDNIDSGEMMVDVTQSWGHEAHLAPDGPQAVAMARELRPDVVLLDIGLPGMDGYQVAARLREEPLTRGACIIAVSGYGQDSDRLKSRAAGCDAHLVKPVDLKTLRRHLDELR